MQLINKIRELKTQEELFRAKLRTINTKIGNEYQICYQNHYDTIVISIVRSKYEFNSDRIIQRFHIDYHCDINIPIDELDNIISIMKEELLCK